MAGRTPKAKIVALCSTYLGDEWKDAGEEDVSVEHLSHGLANENFRCVYKGEKSNGKTPLDVVVHIFGSEYLDFDTALKINGEVGESIIESILCREGLAPRLLAVFPRGRIDEFVPSKNLDSGTVKDPQVFHKIAEKLARFHSLQVPISKKTHLVQKFVDIISSHVRTKACGQLSNFFNNSILVEHRWYEEVIRKVSGRPVFTHGDPNPNNILVIESKEGTAEDVMLIDYEFSSYFFRGYDIAHFFVMSRCKLESADGKLKFTRVGPEHSEEAKLTFLEKYLDESRKLNGYRFCPIHDSLENLQLEVELSEAYVILLMVGWITCFSENMHTASKELGQILYPEFLEMKKKAMRTFSLWNLDHNQKCICVN